MDNLVELYLRGNNLTKIESNTFQHLKKLKILQFRGNQIEQNDLEGFNNTTLKQLN